MTPISYNSKRKLQECHTHLELASKSKDSLEFETHLYSFITTARSITWVIQKELAKEPGFASWWEEKQLFMENDELCKFFVELRNKIEKEGAAPIIAQTEIKRIDTRQLMNKPENTTGIVITGKGIFWVVNGKSPKEMLVPIHDKTISAVTKLAFPNFPKKHKGKILQRLSSISLCELYYKFLSDLVVEAFEKFSIINEKKEI